MKSNEDKRSKRNKDKAKRNKIRKLKSIVEWEEFKSYSDNIRNPKGRPTIYDGLNGPLVGKILNALMMDLTVEEACAVADISRDTFYNWCKEYQEFSDKVEQSKEFLFVVAKKNVADHLAYSRRFDQSIEFLGKRQGKRYRTSTETVNKEYHELTDEEKKAIEDVLDKHDL